MSACRLCYCPHAHCTRDPCFSSRGFALLAAFVVGNTAVAAQVPTQPFTYVGELSLLKRSKPHYLHFAFCYLPEPSCSASDRCLDFSHRARSEPELLCHLQDPYVLR